MELNYKNKKSREEILASAQKTCSDKTLITKNTVISGDNFVVLTKLLNSNLRGGVDLIYIDPPFSTKLDFVVSENRISTISTSKTGQIAYSDKLPFEDYLEYIRERVILMYELLSEQGSFYFHIDTKVGHYLKIILDEIFGYKNFINDITRKKSNPKNFQRKAYGNEKDVIFYYAKNKGRQIWNDVKTALSSQEINTRYNKIDAKGRRYNTVPIHAPGECSGETGSEWAGIKPPAGRHWRTSPKELTKLNLQGLIEWSKTGNPRLIKYADKHEGKKIQDIWLDYKDSPYPAYPTEKNYDMLDMIVKQSSNEGSYVLDAFAGSGTTLLAAKNNNRKFIGIDNEKFALKVIKQKLGADNLFGGGTLFMVQKDF